MELLINKYEELSEKFDNESVKLSKKLDLILEKEEQGSVITARETRNKKVYGQNSIAISQYLNNINVIITNLWSKPHLFYQISDIIY